MIFDLVPENFNNDEKKAKAIANNIISRNSAQRV
jgi:hypothetical protein